MVGYWGGFEFEVNGNRIFTFDGFSRKSSILIDEQELDGAKPSTYIKGEALEEISITVKLKSDLGIDVKGEIDKFKTALYNKNPQTFIIGNKPLSQNKWLLLSVDESETVLDNGGNYISAIIALSFKEYARGGSKKAETSSGGVGGMASGVSGASTGSTTKTKGATTGGVIDKPDGTRDNPNADFSKSGQYKISPPVKTIIKLTPKLNFGVTQGKPLQSTGWEGAL